MINSPNSRVSNMAKDFGVKTKAIIEILEGKGIADKKPQSVLTPDEYGLVVESLTRQNQITNMTQYLSGEAVINLPEKKTAKKEETKAEEPKIEAPQAEIAKADAPKAEAPKTEVPKAEAPKTEAPKTEIPKAEAPKTEAPKTEASKADVPKTEEAKPAQFRPNTNTRPQSNGFSQQRNDRFAQNGNAPRGDRHAQGSQAPRRDDRAPFGSNRPTQNGTQQGGFDRRPSGNGFNNRDNGRPQGDRPYGGNQGGFRQNTGRPNGGGFGGGFNKDIDPKEGRPTRRAPAPKPEQPQATSYSKPTATGGSTRVVDTRGSDNVNLAKYDEKLDTFVPETAKDMNGAKQKLKKQNNRSQYDKKRRSDKEREAMEKMRRAAMENSKKIPDHLTLPESMQVNELAAKLHVTNGEIVKKLMLLGVMASVNQVIDFDTAALIAGEFGTEVTQEVVVTIEEKLFEAEEDNEEDLITRAPVVCVMGHVDHGKTSLLDAIRHTNVTSGEAGGITQAIGAYRVQINGKDITFLDTPGHEAFTAMRARGAKSTDIAILVVAADDGIMPQTVEAINHAKAANIPIIVAINKMDKPHANPDMVKQSLTAYDLVPEEWGGETICVPVSALTRMGIEELLEMVLLVAEVKDLRANPNRRAKGLVLESRLDKGRGPVATLLVQNGTMHTGDVLIAGTSVGRVRAMINDKGRTVKEAGPSVPVEITGLSEIPQAGDEFACVEDERMARTLAEQRRDAQKEEIFKANARANLDTLFAQIKEGVKDLNIIIKADVAGSAEAVKASLIKLSNEEVKVNVIHTAVGGITEGDVMLAAASNAIIIGFAVRPDKSALDSAANQGVEIRTYRIIYECIDEVEAAMKGMLAPTFKEALLGHAEVRQTIHVPNVGTIAGSYILDGKVTRQSQIRVVRDGIVIFEDSISSLKRFKDDAKEVAQGFECGIGLEKFNDIKVGDILEAFIMEEVKRD